MKFDERIRQQVEENPNFYNQNAAEIPRFVGDFLHGISEDLDHFEDEVEETFKFISGVVVKLEFEISGVFRQAKITNCCIPPIPKDLQKRILR